MSGSRAYPISAPVIFTNTADGDDIDFQADITATSGNDILNFVTNAPGDIIFRSTSGTTNTLDRLAIGTDGQVLKVSGTAVAQDQDVIAVADSAGSLNGTYFLISSPTTQYYAWIDVSSGGTDPGTLSPVPSDLVGRTGIEIDIATNDAATVVAAAIETALDAVSGTPFAASVVSATVTVVQNTAGACDDMADGATATGFTFSAVSVNGASPSLVWGADVPSADQSFMAIGNTSGTVAAASTWTTLLDSTGVTWNDSTGGGHDTGSNFNTTTGVFTVPTTGLYYVSAYVQFSGDNSGNGVTISGRRAIRQIRIRKSNATAFTAAFGELQAMASNDNPTGVRATGSLSLTASDTILLQVRHDANSALSMGDDEDGSTSGGLVTYFEVHRIG